MSNTRIPESHVGYLFGYALGFVAGANATRGFWNREPAEFEDLPQGFSLAGTALDEQMGDAILRSKGNWFLLELKRSYANLRDELHKPRVSSLRKLAPDIIKRYPRAASGHRFLYLASVNRGRPRNTLVTQSYLEWLAKLDKVGNLKECQKDAQHFLSFLLNVGSFESTNGFEDLKALQDYADAIWQGGSSDGKGGKVPENDDRLVLCITESGDSTLVTFQALKDLCRMRQEMSEKALPDLPEENRLKKPRPPGR